MKSRSLDDWKETELREIATDNKFAIVDGPFGTQLHAEDYTKFGVPVVRIKNLSYDGTFIEDDLVYISEEKADRLKRSEVKSGDIIIAKTGATIGKSGIFPSKFKRGLIASSCLKISINRHRAIPEFITYLICSPSGQKKILNESAGSTRNSINITPFSKIKFTIPTSTKIQQEIVSVLDKAKMMKRLRREANDLTRQYLKAIFLHIFGDPKFNNKKWDIISINECLESSQYGTSSKSNDKKIGYPIVGMNHLSVNGEINLTKYNHVNISKDEFTKLKLQKGDVLFNRTNSPELIGKTACWNNELDSAVFASYLVKLKMKSNCNPIFFTHLMNTDYFKELFFSSSKKAVNQANISPTLLKTFPMYLPPIHLQNQFSLIVDEINKMKHYQTISNEKIDEMFSNLIQKAFNGEIAC